MDSNLIDKSFEELEEILLNNDVVLNGSTLKVSLTPYELSSKEYENISKQSELILEAVEIVLAQYLVNPMVQNFYPECEHLKDVIRLDTHQPLKRYNQFSRFDIIVDENGKMGIMELNTGCPGGILLTPFFKDLFEQLEWFEDHVNTPGIQKQPFDNLDFFFKKMVNFYQEIKKTTHVPTMAFLTNKNRIGHTDRNQFMAIGEKFGYNVLLAFYDELEYDGTHLSCNGKTIDLVWNKYDFSIEDGKVKPWFYTKSIDETKNFLQAVSDGNVLSWNGFLSYLVGESKKTLALLCDERFHYLFTQDQVKAIKELCLPTFVLQSSNPEMMKLKQTIMDNKNVYVVKSSTDTRGRGIFIGDEMDQSKWNDAVDKAVDGPFVIQQFVKSQKTMVLDPYTKSLMPMNATLGFLIVEGQAAGYFSRCSPNLINNVHSAGVPQVSYVVQHNR
ncbi:hypothetical protein DLAC_07500 [Tieghemostelium lacteum]|uniref:Glutathionylspermidine synthase pre-ATP-grasp-like domain-containing protein n=1 Tax=Tieghemostelium lacteum TaxID=361077 RepID=A0A151ZCP3_TIELA|nr:hypothetical protein DLAC_07500 [Tieghemostelium lacteum]|eukprot:KYQ91718.1 hypothetical protein DLAC_07500 [Tieghemostelium lacteum]